MGGLLSGCGFWRRAPAIGCLFLFGTVASVPTPALAIPKPHKVIVFYANETTAQAFHSPNTQRLLALLNQSTAPVAATIRSSVEQDAVTFPAAVSANITDLLALARSVDYDIVIFTNELTLAHRFVVLRHSSDSVERHVFTPAISAAADPALADSPLSRPDYLAAALDQVGGLYPGQRTDVILITDSHGGETMALMPRVSADFLDIDPARFLAALAAPTGLARLWQRNDELVVRQEGTDKITYWTVLARESRRNPLHFALVLRLSCESGISSWAELWAIPASIAAVGHTGDSALGYRQVNYASIFSAAHGQDDFLASLETALRRQGIVFNSAPALYLEACGRFLGPIAPVLLFLPLGLWIWLAARDAMLRRTGTDHRRATG